MSSAPHCVMQILGGTALGGDGIVPAPGRPMQPQGETAADSTWEEAGHTDDDAR